MLLVGNGASSGLPRLPRQHAPNTKQWHGPDDRQIKRLKESGRLVLATCSHLTVAKTSADCVRGILAQEDVASFEAEHCHRGSAHGGAADSVRIAFGLSTASEARGMDGWTSSRSGKVGWWDWLGRMVISPGLCKIVLRWRMLTTRSALSGITSTT